MKPYPRTPVNTLEDVFNILRYITRERENDIVDFNNLSNVFMRGRKVGKIPTASNDVDPADKVGDFNYTVSYLYILVDNAGTAVWRRATLGSW